METEQTSHEKEESLMLSQFGTPQGIPHKLQNGSQSSEGDLQINGDANWNHFKPNTGVNCMKRHNSSLGQGLFDQEAYMMNGEFMNGELKHALTEQSLLVHQPKRPKIEPGIKGNADRSASLLDNFPALTKATEFECNAQHREVTLDKRHCNFQNGDIFYLPRDKHVSVPNGAISPPSTIETTPGDLLEKTLSQYYPEQVSIATNTSGSQHNAANSVLANKLPSEGAQQLSLTSGLHMSAQMPETQEEQNVTSGNAKVSKDYSPATNAVNGYSNSFGIEHQQAAHQQRLPTHSSQELSAGYLAGMSLPKSTANTSQQQNGSQCYPTDTVPQGLYGKSSPVFTQTSFLNQGASLQTAETSGYNPGPYPERQKMGQVEGLGAVQHQHFSTNSGHQHGIQPQNIKPHVGDRMGPMTESLKHSVVENRVENNSNHRSNLSSTPHQRGWIELNASHPHQQHQGGQSSLAPDQDIWKGLSAKPQSDPRAANHHLQRQMLQLTPEQRPTTDFMDSSQRANNVQKKQQDCLPAQPHCVSAQHNTASEWQRSGSEVSQMRQPLPEQLNFTPNQSTVRHYHTQVQSEPLCEDPDLQKILSPRLLTTQQQHCHLERPLSHPPQYEGQRPPSTNYRPHSQPPPGHQQPPIRSNKPISGQVNNSQNQHNDNSLFSYNNSKEIQQLQQSLLENSPDTGNSTLKQYQPQQPNSNCQEPNNKDFPQLSSQSQTQLLQGASNPQVSTQMYLEQQLKTSSTQVQCGPRLPMGPLSPSRDLQRHAALRMHLLQRQDRQNPSYPAQGIIDPKSSFKSIKLENGPRFEAPALHQPELNLKMQGAVQVKQENQESLCMQGKSQGSILASMEQSLKQYQLSPVFEKKSFVINAANKVKVESSGSVTVLSTNTDINGVESFAAATNAVAVKNTPDVTPKKENLLQSFMESPMKLLDTPIKNLLDTPLKTQYDIASCHCVEQISEKDEGPYYTHLGSAPSVAGIRELMEKRSGLTGRAIRIEKVIYTGKEGKSTQGCPIAKWVIRRSSVEEKVLVLVRQRNGHTCDTACIIVVILVWEGIQPALANRLYLELGETLTKHGAHTQRRCALNEERTCACQGLDPEFAGASFSFGCSWSMYYNGCKFARSKIPRKFKLLGDDVKEEEKLEKDFQNLATLLGPLYKTMAPEAYGNQVEHERRAPDCRLGLQEGRPFSGVTACMDFCAHAHRDLHNMQGGSTVVCTLTREDNREIGKIPEDEQLHVLPLYKASNTDEFGSEEGQQEKIKSGAIQVLSTFRREVRMLAEPAKSCRQKKLDAKKAAANKNAMLESANDKAEKALLSKQKAGSFENTTQSTHVAGAIPGAIGAPIQQGLPQHQPGAHPQQLQQQQHQRILPPYPGSTNAPNYPKYPSHPGSFPSTSKPGSLYPPQPPTPTSPYATPLHTPNSYMNRSNQPYPGYKGNGGMPIDNFLPYYASNPKHMDMYQQQRPALYPEQQYSAHHRYEVNYPPMYGQPGMQVDGYNPCNMRPVHSMRPYAPYGPNGGTELQFMDPLSRAPTVHGGLDYTSAVSQGTQFGGYPNPYLSRGPQMLPPGQDPFKMQIKTETGMPGPQIPPSPLGGGCLKPEPQSGLGHPNGSLLASGIKQEPGTPQTPTTPQKPVIWSDNEHNFLDPDIGGVAVAPSHGSVLIECAKRELHATTPLKNPDRQHPTRISLVFYQHKNLNEAKHGLALWEAKMAEKAREKEEDAERNGGEGTPSKSNKKGVKREHSELSEANTVPPYKRFIQTLLEGSLSCTTNTYVSTAPYAFTKVTGPYSKFV